MEPREGVILCEGFLVVKEKLQKLGYFCWRMAAVTNGSSTEWKPAPRASVGVGLDTLNLLREKGDVGSKDDIQTW